MKVAITLRVMKPKRPLVHNSVGSSRGRVTATLRSTMVRQRRQHRVSYGKVFRRLDSTLQIVSVPLVV